MLSEHKKRRKGRKKYLYYQIDRCGCGRAESSHTHLLVYRWAIDENKGYELTGETVFGLTSTNAQGHSVVSYVGFTSNFKKTEQELNETVDIRSLSSSSFAAPSVIYAPNGTPRDQMSHGVNIVKSGDKVSKIYQR